jgi:hypothetical protein
MLGQINILCIKKKRKRKRKQQIKKKILPQYIRSHLLEGYLKYIGSIGQEETWCKHIPAVTQFRTCDINNEKARIMRELIYSTW